MRNSRRLASLTLVAMASAVMLPAQNVPAPMTGMDRYIEQAMKDWAVAGLAVAVVKNDSVVYARGFGLREVGKPARVDANTIFAIGSNTKLFTAVVAGMLVDDGVLRWDEPVTSYLPEFQLSDPWVTREVTLRDLLSHRTGLGQQEGNFMALGTGRDRRDIIRRMRYLKPATSFRSRFGYQNLGPLTAGEAAAAAAGQSWDDLVANRILTPLGMTSTSTSVRALTTAINVATPHTSDGDRATPIPWREIDSFGPSGSINSNLSDMTKWLRFLLARGKSDGRQLLKPTTLGEIESPHSIMPFTSDPLRPSMHFQAYGLGVMLHDYRGVKVVSHTGGIDGMLSAVTLVPEEGLGVVVLTNTDRHNMLFIALERRIVDAWLGAPQRDWSRIMLEQYRAFDRAIVTMEAEADARRAKATPPTLPRGKYVGRYHSDMYGNVDISLDRDRLVLQFGEFVGDLNHWAQDTWKLKWRTRGPVLASVLVSFEVDPFGRIVAMRLRDDLLLPPEARAWHVSEFAPVRTATSSASR